MDNYSSSLRLGMACCLWLADGQDHTKREGIVDNRQQALDSLFCRSSVLTSGMNELFLLDKKREKRGCVRERSSGMECYEKWMAGTVKEKMNSLWLNGGWWIRYCKNGQFAPGFSPIQLLSPPPHWLRRWDLMRFVVQNNWRTSILEQFSHRTVVING